jgi:O-antigen/teichoic acid export membrane protein
MMHPDDQAPAGKQAPRAKDSVSDPVADRRGQGYDLSRRSSKNAAFSGGAFLYTAVIAVIVTPVLVHRLGPVYYGIFSLSAAALGFVGMLDLGMTTALVRFLSKSVAEGDEQETRALIRSSVTFYGAVGAAGIVAMSLLAFVFAPALFNLHGSALDVAKFAFAVAGLGFAFDVLTRGVSTIPLSLQRYDVAAYVRIVSGTVVAAASAAVVLAGYGLRVLISVNVALDALGLIVAVIIGRRLVPAISFRPSADARRIKRLMTFSVWVFIGNLSAFVLYQFDRFLLGALDSVAAVTYYAVAASTASYVYAVVGSIAAVVIPASTELFSRGEWASVRRLYERATRACVLCVGSIGIPIVIFAHQVLDVWLGAVYSAKISTLLQILVLTFALLSLTVIPFNILIGAGKPRIVAILNGAIAVLNVVLVVALVPAYGARGAAIAYLISVLLFPLFIWHAERTALGYQRIQWPSIVWRTLPGLAVQCVVCLAIRRAVDGPYQVGLALLLTLPIPALVYVFGRFIDDDERRIAAALIRR